MTKISKIEPKTYQGKITGHTVTLSDGVVGYLDDKKSSPGLKEGDEVIYTLTTPLNKQNKPYNLLVLSLAGAPPVQQSAAQSQQPAPSAPPKPSIHVGTPKSVQELKADASIRSMGFMIELFIHDKIEWPQVSILWKETYSALKSEIDDSFKA